MSEPRILPAADPRVETGTVQFGDDWPGLFVRGDTAYFLAHYVEWVLGELPEETRGHLKARYVEGLAKMLRATRVKPRGV